MKPIVLMALLFSVISPAMEFDSLEKKPLLASGLVVATSATCEDSKRYQEFAKKYLENRDEFLQTIINSKGEKDFKNYKMFRVLNFVRESFKIGGLVSYSAKIDWRYEGLLNNKYLIKIPQAIIDEDSQIKGPVEIRDWPILVNTVIEGDCIVADKCQLFNVVVFGDTKAIVQIVADSQIGDRYGEVTTIKSEAKFQVVALSNLDTFYDDDILIVNKKIPGGCEITSQLEVREFPDIEYTLDDWLQWICSKFSCG